MDRLGRLLFRARSWLGAVWVMLLLVFCDPWITLWSVLFFMPGLAIRFWAAGFIGPTSRNLDMSADHLAARGPYSIFRHPLYLANGLLVAAGLALLRPHWILIVLTALGFLVLYITIGIAEEQRLVEKYGQRYEDYKRRVKPFFPIRYEGPLFKGFNLRWALGEWQTWLTAGLLFGLAFLRAEVVPLLIKISQASSLILRLDTLKAIAKALLVLLR